MLHTVVMAGGAGTRFWPESRRLLPKQLLRLLGERTMIQHTLDRLAGLTPSERMLVVTNADLVPAMKEQLPELPAASIVGEPCKRDTAPCIGLAALLVSRDDPDAVMLVLPADHIIRPVEKFQQACRLAAELATAPDSEGRIVTFGIRPTYPAEIFGYIERGEAWPVDGDQPAVYRVRKFREKPPRTEAQRYLESGEFYWNSGIFVWKARTILEALAERQPAMFERLQTIGQAAGTERFDAVLNEEFPRIVGTSIDYAVMEHATDVLVVEAPFAWDDVGSWQALQRLQPTDADGNVIAARHLGLNTRDCIIRGGSEHLICTLGVRDCIIVHTPDATLVANKNDEESIRQLVKQLEERGWNAWL